MSFWNPALRNSSLDKHKATVDCNMIEDIASRAETRCSCCDGRRTVISWSGGSVEGQLALMLVSVKLGGNWKWYKCGPSEHIQSEQRQCLGDKRVEGIKVAP
eukprot:174752-Amphidinium_carterae.1